MQPHFIGSCDTCHCATRHPLFTSIQTSFMLPHDIHFKVSRIDNGIDIKTPSLIVARRTRAAAVDQRRVDVLSDHDLKLPTKEKCLCVTSHSYLGTYVLTPYVCSDTLPRH